MAELPPPPTSPSRAATEDEEEERARGQIVHAAAADPRHGELEEDLEEEAAMSHGELEQEAAMASSRREKRTERHGHHRLGLLLLRGGLCRICSGTGGAEARRGGRAGLISTVGRGRSRRARAG
nr:unnamed protein product [Digitaria exilis]